MEGDVFAIFNMAPQSKYGAIWRILDPSAYGFGNARVSLCTGAQTHVTREGCNVISWYFCEQNLYRRLGTSHIRFHDSHDSLVEPRESVLRLLACSLRHYAIFPRFQTFCRGTLLSTLSTIYDFPQNLRKFCFNFSRVECWLQEKLKTKLLQKFVGKKTVLWGN